MNVGLRIRRGDAFEDFSIASKEDVQKLKEESSASIKPIGNRGNLAGYETATVMSGDQTITVDSPDCINLTTSGNTTLTFTASSDATLRAVKSLVLVASANTTLSISGATWANNGTDPIWGDAGTELILLAHFVNSRVILSVVDNTQV